MYTSYEEKERLRKDSKIWRAALYIRLSKEDKKMTESESVISQKEILKEYLKLQPDIEFYDYYIDDGYSGTNFDRPGFKRMMDDIYSGKVDCVIVKDLSRFGRNHADMGYYTDNVFARHHIRFISLNNGVDTASNNMNAATRCISVGVTNVLNESVAATTSVNVRGSLNVRRRKGDFIGSFASYGYIKDPEDHHKLVIDEDAASVVRMIFGKFLAGMSIMGITRELNEAGIPNPSTYKKNSGFNYRHPAGKINDGLWPESSVRRVLKNEMYTGDMIQGKSTTISYKIKQCTAVPKDDWIIVRGTHEPIIDRETFDKAQSLFNRNIRQSPGKKEVDLFAGLVRCADCGRAMSKKSNKHSYGEYHYYRCTTARKMKKGACTKHTIRIDKIEEAVLVFLQKMVEVAAEYDEIIKKINSDSRRKNNTVHLSKEVERKNAERENLRRMMLDLYPDWKNGVITKSEYDELKADLQAKIEKLDDLINKLREKIEEYERGIGEDNSFVVNFRRIGNIERLTRPVLTELIEEILVHEGGNITIRLKCKDAFEKAAEYIEMNKDIAKPA